MSPKKDARNEVEEQRERNRLEILKLKAEIEREKLLAAERAKERAERDKERAERDKERAVRAKEREREYRIMEIKRQARDKERALEIKIKMDEVMREKQKMEREREQEFKTIDNESKPDGRKSCVQSKQSENATEQIKNSFVLEIENVEKEQETIVLNKKRATEILQVENEVNMECKDMITLEIKPGQEKSSSVKCETKENLGGIKQTEMVKSKFDNYGTAQSAKKNMDNCRETTCFQNQSEGNDIENSSISRIAKDFVIVPREVDHGSKQKDMSSRDDTCVESSRSQRCDTKVMLNMEKERIDNIGPENNETGKKETRINRRKRKSLKCKGKKLSQYIVRIKRRALIKRSRYKIIVGTRPNKYRRCGKIGRKARFKRKVKDVKVSMSYKKLKGDNLHRNVSKVNSVGSEAIKSGMRFMTKKRKNQSIVKKMIRKGRQFMSKERKIQVNAKKRKVEKRGKNEVICTKERVRSFERRDTGKKTFWPRRLSEMLSHIKKSPGGKKMPMKKYKSWRTRIKDDTLRRETMIVFARRK